MQTHACMFCELRNLTASMLSKTHTTQHAHALHTQTHSTSLPNHAPRSVDRGFRTAPLIRLVGPDDGLLSLTHDGPRVYLNIEDYLYYNQRWGRAGWLQLFGTLLSCQLHSALLCGAASYHRVLAVPHATSRLLSTRRWPCCSSAAQCNPQPQGPPQRAFPRYHGHTHRRRALHCQARGRTHVAAPGACRHLIPAAAAVSRCVTSLKFTASGPAGACCLLLPLCQSLTNCSR